MHSRFQRLGIKEKSDILNKMNSPDHTFITMATRCAATLAGRTSPWDLATRGLVFEGSALITSNTNMHPHPTVQAHSLQVFSCFTSEIIWQPLHLTMIY